MDIFSLNFAQVLSIALQRSTQISKLKFEIKKIYNKLKKEKKKFFFIFGIRLSNSITKRHMKFQAQIEIFRVSV